LVPKTSSRPVFMISSSKTSVLPEKVPGFGRLLFQGCSLGLYKWLPTAVMSSNGTECLLL
jgi:hypothetical protein